MELDRILTHSHGRALSRLLTESARVVSLLFPGSRIQRVAGQLDRRIGALPGLAGVSLLGPFLGRSAGSESPGLLAAA